MHCVTSFSAGNKADVSMGRAGSVSLADQAVSTTNQEEHILTGHTAGVLCFAMFEDRLLFSGSVDCTIKVRVNNFHMIYITDLLVGLCVRGPVYL